VITAALLLDEQLALCLGTRQLPPPLTGEALVRVLWAGVCGSDLHVLRTGEWVNYWPATLGHEVVGVVQECTGAEVAPGTVVVVAPAAKRLFLCARTFRGSARPCQAGSLVTSSSR
jgi:D-arabinose 1-dehydrogenase-like Zn-dependent alcohol dehydrogenase